MTDMFSIIWLGVISPELLLALSCKKDEFECNYAADGCIPWEKVHDGVVDCIRDGFDESAQIKQASARQKFPKGSFFFPQKR